MLVYAFSQDEVDGVMESVRAKEERQSRQARWLFWWGGWTGILVANAVWMLLMSLSLLCRCT